MRRWLAASSMVGALAVASIGAHAVLEDPPTAVRDSWGSAHPIVELLEDDPRWDCRVHGNRICGEVNPHGEFELIWYPPNWLERG